MFPGFSGVGRRLSALVLLVALAAGWPLSAMARILTASEVASPGAAPLNCARLTSPEAMAALVLLPAPRVINLQGSVPIVTMEPFARFLIAMGYPETSVRNPRDGAWSTSSYTSSTMLAGIAAWHYEQTGMRPMLIGHSQGGMLVVRTLHELDGAFASEIPVYDPVHDLSLARTTIRDPYTGQTRPVRGLRVAFGAAIATGMMPRVLLGQWSMLARLRKIPDTVDEFTGFTIAWDPIAGNFGEAETYTPNGDAVVRNVLLPATTSHIGAPLTEHLAADPVTRQAVAAWQPGDGMPVLPGNVADARNIQHAADLWFSIRRHWCLEGQRALRLPGTT